MILMDLNKPWKPKYNKYNSFECYFKAKFKELDQRMPKSNTGIWRAYEMGGSKAIPPEAY